MAPKGIQFLIPANVNVISYDKRDLEDIYVKDLVMGRLSWIIQVL